MNIDRDRARHALEAIEKLENQAVDKYVSYVKALPATILQNGFGQAMATLLAASKGKDQHQDDHKRLYHHLDIWLCKNNTHSPYHGQPDLMKAITTKDEPAYLHAQAEAMAYLQWLKKFAVAYLTATDSTGKEKNP